MEALIAMKKLLIHGWTMTAAGQDQVWTHPDHPGKFTFEEAVKKEYGEEVEYGDR